MGNVSSENTSLGRRGPIGDLIKLTRQDNENVCMGYKSEK